MPDAIAEAINLPFEEAIQFFRQKTRTPTAHWDDIWRTAHDHGFMVAGAASDDLLKDFQDALQDALDNGTTLETFRAAFDDLVERHGWSYNGGRNWRTRIIYETNLSMAYAAGRYAQMTEPDTLTAYPFWTYRHGACAHPRIIHVGWDGLTLRANDPWWSSHYPPNGWRCHCYVSPTSGAGLGRMGKDKPDTAPALDPQPWRNPRTGKVHLVPKGIDPGFDYNPGKAWIEGARALPVKGPGWRPVK
ncbi:MAG TPA: phage minor head protein [Gammaproteobacteria bacterium]|nr:phage minor head protein [Gammaproteobacteria bacterium]